MGETGRHFASLFPSQAPEFDEDHIDLIQLFAMVSKTFPNVFFLIRSTQEVSCWFTLCHDYYLLEYCPICGPAQYT